MKEIDWTKDVTERLHKALSAIDSSICVESGKRLVYANEIKKYCSDSIDYNEMAYETDILIYEIGPEEEWKPRVIIETKVDSVTTHDAITYSQKAATHKFVHPYLRYGIFIGNSGNSHLPGRLFRHGSFFDFMLSWKNYEPSGEEWQTLIDLSLSEIEASRKLEELIFHSRKKDRDKYYLLHKPLILKNNNE